MGAVEVHHGHRNAASHPAAWNAFAALMGLYLLALLAVLPIVAARSSQGPSRLAAFGVDALVALLLGALASWLGLWLGGRVGLGAPLLRARPESAAGVLLSAVCIGLGFGAFTAVSLWALQALSLLPGDLWSEAQRTPWKGILVSVSAAIKEEILLRFGLMTLLVWLFARLTRRESAGPGAVWAGNVVAALLFGAAHLPAAASVTTLTAAVVAVALVFNAIAGVIFGWLYWRRGILAAIVAHFSADIVLQVLFPLVVGASPGDAKSGG
ncbi:CPBP family intramembrane glutamic endopeptidase [Polyangium aurulentum]|uniref:CPBP family intramembrane glutamic endopeptidase n=1 Tax=Polyangium aurulentum TaxID=2567896 RepID=UPI0010AE8A30|nr:CPBP family intramembrane glutamic endopeptidase [Polyangium aurulentum]UQA62671.1 CPBP family intramembrane metalloprotease [Polyangium aurulentum]